jgi:hypothetical protein
VPADATIHQPHAGGVTPVEPVPFPFLYGRSKTSWQTRPPLHLPAPAPAPSRRRTPPALLSFLLHPRYRPPPSFPFLSLTLPPPILVPCRCPAGAPPDFTCSCKNRIASCLFGFGLCRCADAGFFFFVLLVRIGTGPMKPYRIGFCDEEMRN